MSDHTAEIIQFSEIASRPKFGKKTEARPAPRPAPRCEDGMTETCRNQRLRSDRRDVWREVEGVMDYWHISMKMNDAISRVQRHDAPEGKLHPAYKHEDHWNPLAKYREAWARLMLTPAPDALAVVWKRAQLKAGHHKHTDLKPERIERAIADDVEFLRSHPTRRGGHYSPKRDLEQ
jgi:hypothetical protein